MPIRRIAALALLLLAIAGCATRPHDEAAPPLLLISIDGLRPADITAQQMPVLHALGEAGARADGMRPSYPSLTFPNHYSMITGLRPDHHGIVHNTMRDAALGGFKTSSHEAVRNAGWWGGTPVWVSAERAGLRTATMFWPGSEAAIHGVRPREWREYDDATSAADGANTVAAWLAVTASQRPRFVTLYLDEVDEASHDHGPDSAQAIIARRDVDAAIGALLQRLRELQLLDAMNIVVVSDHGFATVPPGQAIGIDDMAAADIVDAVSDGQVIEFAPKPGNTIEAERALLGRHDHYECWRKGELPARWQYGTHPRIPAIVCQMDAGWDALWSDKLSWRRQHEALSTRGSHGYDPDLPAMRASFIATGPAFRSGARLPIFDNVDVYPLLMRLLRLPVEPNDGDIAPLLPALKDGE